MHMIQHRLPFPWQAGEEIHRTGVSPTDLVYTRIFPGPGIIACISRLELQESTGRKAPIHRFAHGCVKGVSLADCTMQGVNLE